MIPEIGFREQIPIDELPQWVIDLRATPKRHESVAHEDTRSGMRVFKIEEDKFVVISRYAPYKLLAYIVEVCTWERANEHIGYDVRAEIQWEREQDMIQDAREEAYADREPEDYEEW